MILYVFILAVVHASAALRTVVLLCPVLIASASVCPQNGLKVWSSSTLVYPLRRSGSAGDKTRGFCVCCWLLDSSMFGRFSFKAMTISPCTDALIVNIILSLYCLYNVKIYDGIDITIKFQFPALLVQSVLRCWKAWCPANVMYPCPFITALSYTSSSDIRVLRGWIQMLPTAVIYPDQWPLFCGGVLLSDSGEQHPRFQGCVSFLSGAVFSVTLVSVSLSKSEDGLTSLPRYLILSGRYGTPGCRGRGIDNEDFTQLTKSLNFIADVS